MTSKAKKKIGVDLLLLSQFSHTGIVTYALEIVPRLISLIPEVEWHLYTSKHALAGLSIPSYVHVHQSRWMRSAWIWKLFGASYEALKSGIDLMLFPTTRVPLLKTTKSAVFVHDLGFLSHAEYLQRGTLRTTQLAMKLTAKTGDLLLTNSEFTRRQFAQAYGVNAESIWATGLGFDQTVFHDGETSETEVNSVSAKYGIKRPYVLYLGVIQGRKNLVRLIRASKLWRQTYPDVQLVLAGKKGWNCDDIYGEAARYSDREVRLAGVIAAEDLRVVYHSAKCFVLPALYEGFGIPLLEAMACGTPVVSSATSALPEVGGDAALYFDPLDVEELSARVVQTFDPAIRGRMIAKGLQQCRRFTWDQCAQKTAQAMRRILGLRCPDESGVGRNPECVEHDVAVTKGS
jgi:glycosyltransferase involved in cell wall biosynthesis